jgi:membrane-associated phospholipid phosphatase
VAHFGSHLRGLWPGWTILAPLPFVADSAWAYARGQGHWENAAVVAIALALFAIGPRTKKLFVGVYPIGLVGLLYDAMRLVQRVGVSSQTVHVCDLRAAEAALFGVTVNGERGTVHDWLQLHASPALDRICAVPYATFIFVCIATAAWLYRRDYWRMRRFGWCFLALNVAGFVTYHVYPAAPPWYYHAHGCAVDVLAHASEGPNLARVDAWLGVPYFAGMYGRSSDVFGAMPSLHCAYALLVVLEGWAVFAPAWRAASIAFFALMCFAAVYLDHHWILDALAGITYCVTVVTAARALARVRAARAQRGADRAALQASGGAP